MELGPTSLAEAVAVVARRSAVSSVLTPRLIARSGVSVSQLDALVQTGLVQRSGEIWLVTRRGVAAFGGGEVDWGAVAAAILGVAMYEQEMRVLLALGDRTSATEARRVAPLVAEVIAWNPAWRDGEDLLPPLTIMEEGLADASLAIPSDRPGWVEEQEEVGRRAEAYTLRREQLAVGANSVLHTSREVGDSAGYDIEVLIPSRRYVEVKGSRSSGIVFTLSRNQLGAAERERSAYEIQFWGDIDLTRSPRDEYPELVAQGWPQVVRDPSQELFAGAWTRECKAWEFRPSDGTDR